MTSTVYLITGCSRGIGLEFVRQILAGDSCARVIAAVREPSKTEELGFLTRQFNGRLVKVKMDVADLESVEAAAKVVEGIEVAKEGIDVLLCNAGVLAGGKDDALSPTFLDSLQANLAVNLFGVASVVQAFLPFLRRGKGKKIWLTSSNSASRTSDFPDPPAAASYSISKASMTFYGYKLARALEKEQGWTVIAFHPGYVETGMTAQWEPELTTEESVRMCLEMLGSKGVGESGRFYRYSGELMPY